MMETRERRDHQARRCRVHNPKGPDFVFEGDMLAEHSSSELGTVRVYRTRSGKWVASQAHEVMYANPNLFRAAVIETDQELIDWLGPSRSGKAIAETLGLDVTTWIE